MLRTNTNVYKARIGAYLLDCIDVDNKEDATPKEKIEDFFKRFNSEFNYDYNAKRFPNRQERVSNYLQGLPIGIDYTYFDILQVAKKLHGCDIPKDKEDKILEHWFNHCAFHLVRLMEKYNLVV